MVVVKMSDLRKGMLKVYEFIELKEYKNGDFVVVGREELTSKAIGLKPTISQLRRYFMERDWAEGRLPPSGMICFVSAMAEE